jgi:hypothetical protein
MICWSSLALHFPYQLVRSYPIITLPTLKPIFKARPLGWPAALLGREYVADQLRMPLLNVPFGCPSNLYAVACDFHCWGGEPQFCTFIRLIVALDVLG